MKNILLLLVLIIHFSFCYSSNTTKPIYLKSKNKALQNFCYIPGGILYVKTDSSYSNDRIGRDRRYFSKEIPVDSFYISSTEISNLQYKEFLDDLLKNNEIEKYKIAFVDTQKWNMFNAYNEPYVVYYFQHPVYQNYPCVNMSYEGAQLYCEWFTKKINQEQNEYIIEAKLPTATQWEYAARNGKKLSSYSWGGPYTQNNQGQKLANYKSISEGCIHFNDSTKQYEIMCYSSNLVANLNESADLTAPTKSFVISDYGLYNMCGNVAEMIDTKGIARGGSWNSPGYDVQVTSEMKYVNASPNIGFRPILIIKKRASKN